MTDIKRTTSGDPLLDDVLDEYAAAGPSRTELERWTRQYPQFRRELIELTVSWLELKHLRAAPATTDPVEAQLRAASIVGEVLYALRSASAPTTPAVESKEVPAAPVPPSIDSLLEQAKRQGLDVEQLASAVKMSVGMIMSLHRRLVVATSIPREVLSALGRILKLSSDTLSEYLNSPPQLAGGQQFKSKQAPRVMEKIDFTELVKNDPELSESERARWLLSIQSSDIARRQT
jgi:hypothetical protein